MLMAYINANKSNWPSLTPYAVFVVNTSINRSTGYTPHELLYGYKLEIPTNVKKKPEPIYAYDDYVAQLRFKLQSAHEIARQTIIATKTQNKKYYDRNTKDITYKVGDKILIKDHARKTKLHNLFKGPYEITEILSDTNVKYKRGTRHIIIHKNEIKLYHEKGEGPNNASKEKEQETTSSNKLQDAGRYMNK